MMVQGQTSGSSGLVQSSLVGNGSGGITASQRHITFTSVTGDFVDGENLVRIAGGNPTYPTGSIAAVGAVVGTVTGLPVLLTSDIFPLQYGRTTAAQAVAGTVTPTRTDNTVQLREVDTKPICRIKGLGLDVQGAREDPDTYIGSSSRNDVIQLRGVYAPEVEWRVRNAWTRAMCVWSDYMGTFTGLVDQMPNHAILTQQAFAYGLELKAGSKGTLIKLRGHTVRHLFTTNPNQRTYSQANNYASGKWSQWDYGTPIRTTVDGFVVEAAFAPGMDTHPGDYYTTFMNGRIHGGGSGGRYNTDNNSAYSTRGFGTKWKNVECDDSAVGFLIGGVEHDAGINHRYVLENVHVSGALAQCVVTPTAMVPGQATVVISSGEFSHRVNYPKDAAGTVEATNTKYGLQVSVQVGDGVNLEVKSDALFRKFGAAAIRALGSGTVTVYSAIADFTENPSSGLAGMIRAEGTRTIKVFEAKYNGNPTYLLRNQSGNSTWLLGDLQWLGTGTAPQLMLTSAGTPTVTQVAPATNAGGSGSSGTQVSVDGTNVSTLDISSTPAVRVLTTSADITGPTASANVADLSAFQTTLPTGTYLLEADLMYSVTSGTAGALRFGFGGAGSAGGSMSNGISTQWTSRTAAVNVILNALATAGTGQAVTEPTANIAGSSPGTFATILNWQLRANLVVTTAGVFGLIWQTSSGADRVGTLKPGSFLKVTKVS
jgi:hypothetical protein